MLQLASQPRAPNDVSVPSPPEASKWHGLPPAADTSRHAATHGGEARLRVVIVEDDPDAAEWLSDLLRQLGETSVTLCAPTAVSVSRLADSRPDLMFLDPDTHSDLMPAVMSLLPENRPLIAFVAESSRHACRAFELGAVDFLLKPVRRGRVAECLARARERRWPMRAPPGPAIRPAGLEDDAATASSFTREFWVRAPGDRHCRVPVEAIDWISSEDDYVCLHVAGRQFMVRSSLGQVQARLDPAAFVRLHRTTLVQRDRLLSVQKRRSGGSEALLANGTKLAVGRVYLSRLPWRAR